MTQKDDNSELRAVLEIATRRNIKLRKLLQSIVADVEAMENRQADYFGPFDYDLADMGDKVIIYWPNLAVLLKQAREALKEESLLNS